MEDMGLRALPPYFKRMETCLAAERDDQIPRHAGPLILERGRDQPVVRRLLRSGAATGSSGRRQRVPAGGFAAFGRNVRWAPPVGARAYLTRDAPAQPRRDDARVRDADPVRGEPGDGRRVRPSRVAAPCAPVGAALRRSVTHRRRSALGGRQRGRRRRSGSTSCRTCGRGPEPQDHAGHVSTRAPSRSRSRRTSGGRSAWVGLGWVPVPARSERRTISRAEGSRGAATRRISELMFHFLPIAVRSTGRPANDHGYRVTSDP
jgi:choline dehydrogenase